MMTRKEFINKINKNGKADYFINLDFYDNNAPDVNEINHEIQVNFPFLLSDDHFDFFHSELDWGFMDDNEDYMGWRFKTEVNLNLIYDDIIRDIEDKPEDMISIYRIETDKGEGIYADGSKSLLLSPGVAPWEEPDLSVIFSKSIFDDYMKKWSFAFKDKDQMKKWLKDEKYETLEQAGLILKEIKINKNKIEEGSDQVVFQKNNISHQKTITFKELFSPAKKHTMKI